MVFYLLNRIFKSDRSEKENFLLPMPVPIRFDCLLRSSIRFKDSIHLTKSCQFMKVAIRLRNNLWKHSTYLNLAPSLSSFKPHRVSSVLVLHTTYIGERRVKQCVFRSQLNLSIIFLCVGAREKSCERVI